MRISVSAVAIALGAVAIALVAVALAILALAGALGGDDDGGSADDGSASQTPFIAPSPYTTEVALQKLDEVELLIKLPNPDFMSKYNISSADLEQRIALVLEGTSDTTGLDDARVALQEENPILAAEYMYNVVNDYLRPAFGNEDSDTITPEQLDEIDPGNIFVDDHSQGMFTTAVFKEAVIKLIHLWSRVSPE
jgi:hypothetical protein